MKQGPMEKKILSQCIAQNRPFPNAIENAPDLEIGLELYYEAFWELATTRPAGMGLYPIPWHTVQYYGETHSFDPEQLEDLHYYIKEMDESYIRFCNQKSESERQQKTAQQRLGSRFRKK